MVHASLWIAEMALATVTGSVTLEAHFLKPPKPHSLAHIITIEKDYPCHFQGSSKGRDRPRTRPAVPCLDVPHSVVGA